MDELTINPARVRMLVVKTRAMMAKEEWTVTPNTGGDFSDDAITESIQDLASDPLRLEVEKEIDGLNLSQQAELVALMWIGRGDAEPEEWTDLLKMADERREVPTNQYLLDHPLLADHWTDGLEKLGYDGLVEEE